MIPNPVLVRIGPLSIYWYGVLIVAGSMLAAQIASILSRRNGHNPETAWNLLLVVLVAGIIGGRLYHVVSSWTYYREHLNEIFGLQMAGFGIYGSVLGGLVGLWLFVRRYHLRYLEWADYCAPGLLLAQAIGRWGNFFNMELYGPPTDLPWGIYVPPSHRLPGLEMYERFHPTFFYESALNLVGAALLLLLAYRWKKGRRWGDILLLYGMYYPFIRFFIEFLRPDAWKVSGIAVAHLVSVGMFIFFGALFVIRHKLSRPAMIYAPGEPWAPPLPPTGQAPDNIESADAAEPAAADTADEPHAVPDAAREAAADASEPSADTGVTTGQQG
jgi:phosphatidylglycerol:prolipoprotein diacylglycerol transferase